MKKINVDKFKKISEKIENGHYSLKESKYIRNSIIICLISAIFEFISLIYLFSNLSWLAALPLTMLTMIFLKRYNLDSFYFMFITLFRNMPDLMNTIEEIK